MATRFRKNLPTANYKAPLNNVEPVPADLADFMMNDWFYGTAPAKNGGKENDLIGENKKEKEEEGVEVVGGKGSTASTGRLTQEWLEEAKRMVADSPSRHASPSRFTGCPRFASSDAREPSPVLQRRDPLSRSARRHRSTESISNEILLKTTARNSVSISSSPAEKSPASAVHQWFSNILNPQPDPTPGPLTQSPPQPGPTSLPPKVHKAPRKSRFQQKDPPPLPLPTKRTFRDAPSPARSEPPAVLSPPRNLVESAHRRSISSSTCSLDGGPATAPRHPSISIPSELAAATVADDVRQINSFLKRQRAAIERIAVGEVSAKAKIVLSTSTTSSIVAAICYAWLLENGEKKESAVVVPVVNMRRGKMWKNKQAAWLFHHLGIDASALLFTDEVDLEGLIMARQLSILVIGQDVLKTNGEVGSQCTVLTDNYCEDAYNLLQAPNLKKFLLAGILLDTQNLNSAARFFTNRDAEAVQLLLVGSSSNYRYELFENLMRDHRSNVFLAAMRNNYGKPSTEDEENGVSQESRLSTRKSTSISPREAKIPSSTMHKTSPVVAPAPEATPAPVSVKAPEPAPRGKNKNFFAKLFSFGSK